MFSPASSSSLLAKSYSTRGDAPMVGVGDLLRQLPETYSGGTTEMERLAHFDLFRKFQAEVESRSANDANDRSDPIFVAWAPKEEGSKLLLMHLCFRDVPGSLSAITATLTEYRVGIVRAVAFCTEAGVAIKSGMRSLARC